MNWVADKIFWIMLITGAITCSMIQAVFDPLGATQLMFGLQLDVNVADVIVRNWGALITLSGLMLIYGAFDVTHRSFILLIVSVSKTLFIIFVLSHGTAFLTHQAGIAVVFDLVAIVLYVMYLLSPQRGKP